MANTKISALTPGTPAQSTDVLPIDRAGANFSLTASDIIGGAAPANVVSTAGTMTSGNVITGAGTKVVQDGGVALSSLAPKASAALTGTTTAVTLNVSKSITSGVNAMGNQTGSITVDLSLGNVITMTLTGNVTITSFTNAVSSAGQNVTFIFTQDGSGGRTVTWPAAALPLGPAPNVTIGAVSSFECMVDGSGNLNFQGPIPVAWSRTTGITGTTSVAALTPAIIGYYRVSTFLTCTATGTGGATFTTQAQGSNGNSSGAVTAALVTTSTDQTIGAVATVKVTAATTNQKLAGKATILGTIGTATMELDILVEYLGA